MGRRTTNEQSPASSALQGSPNNNSVKNSSSTAKRPLSSAKFDSDEVSSAKRQLCVPGVLGASSVDAGSSCSAEKRPKMDTAVNQFRAPDIIAKKRDGKEWSDAEIEWFISEMVAETGNVQECQIGAWLMAVRLQGMNSREIASLTKACMLSGETLQWPEEWQGRLVDKHSTGGVGDKVSLILAPALAACNMKVPMLSGRGLGHTGGTLDKLESMPGYTVLLSSDRMMDILTNVGCCICGQTSNLVPADKKLYAIRDVTGTVASLPLITASIISKKAAERVNALVLDVKMGKSAIMSDDEKLCRKLATSLVSASNMLGTKASALMTRMDNPLGRCIGNSLEVAESLQCLHGKGPADLRSLVVELGGSLLDSVSGQRDGKAQINKALDDGSALGKFRDMIVAQGVEEELANNLCNLPMDEIDEVWSVLTKAKNVTQIEAEEAGYIASIHSLKLAEVCLVLGAGRAVAGADVDHAVGAKLLVDIGSYVTKGQPWMTIYHQEPEMNDNLVSKLQSSLEISADPVTPEHIVIDVIESY